MTTLLYIAQSTLVQGIHLYALKFPVFPHTHFNVQVKNIFIALPSPWAFCLLSTQISNCYFLTSGPLSSCSATFHRFNILHFVPLPYAWDHLGQKKNV